MIFLDSSANYIYLEKYLAKLPENKKLAPSTVLQISLHKINSWLIITIIFIPVQLLAEEAVAVANLDAGLAREVLASSQTALGAATSEEGKAEAMIQVEVAEELVKAVEA